MSDTDFDVIDQTSEDVKIDFPNLWGVKFLNDDYTPMDFVVIVLAKFFKLDIEQAMAVMLEVHNNGSSVVGSYTRDIAETKADMVMQFAEANQHPLRLTPVAI